MTRLVVTRLAWALVVAWFVVSAAFLVVVALPADPARALAGPHASPASVERARRRLCLDRPLHVQYACHVGRLARGDLGTSYRTRLPVRRLLAERIGPTAQLAGAAVGLQLLLGVPLGLWAARRRSRGGAVADGAVRAAAVVSASTPVFFLGPLLVYLLAYRLRLFPVSGTGAPGLDRLWHLTLPALTLAIVGAGATILLVRAGVLEALAGDPVRTARAKGLPERLVVLRHALPQAMVPVIALAGVDLGALLGGAVVTEHLFAWPGLGRETALAILNLDLPVVLGIAIVAALAVTIVNLLVDLAVGLLDPRTRG